MIDGLLSLEVRWFLDGELPEEVRRWFNHDCPGDLLGSPEEREDLYLYVPQCEYLNLKLRQGSLEVKWRKAQLGNQQLAGFEGKIERWLKWTCEDSAEHDLVSTAEGRAWVGVKKVRSQRLYQEVAYELTQLTVNNNTWWSLAFELTQSSQDTVPSLPQVRPYWSPSLWARNLEAAGELSELIDRFTSVVIEICQNYQGPQLSVQQSFAYPRWLSFQF